MGNKQYHEMIRLWSFNLYETKKNHTHIETHLSLLYDSYFPKALQVYDIANNFIRVT